MKNITTFLFTIFAIVFTFTSCENEPLEGFDLTGATTLNASVNGTNTTGGSTATTINPFAMSYKLDGVQHMYNNPLNTNLQSTTNIFGAYPLSDYVLFQSRNGILGGANGILEINIWLDKNHLVENTSYTVDDTTSETTSHIDLIDLTNTVNEETLSGTIYVDYVNLAQGVVRGRFDFVAGDPFDATSPRFNITEGEFEYILL